MWSLVYVCAIVLATVSEAVGDGDVISDSEWNVFRKCCPKHQSLVKVVAIDDEHFDCMSRKNLETAYNISYSPLVISDNIPLDVGMPMLCDDLKEIKFDLETELLSSATTCYDRLTAVVINGTLTQYIPQTVALTCTSNDTDEAVNTTLKINNIRKCCPKGQFLDTEYHACRTTEHGSGEKWFIKNINLTNDYIYEVDTGLQCKTDEYAVELKENLFSFSIKGSILNAWSKSDKNKGGEFVRGEWCIDDEYGTGQMISKVCTRNCGSLSAFCIRKCCPEGYHYKVRRCSSLISTCVPNVDEHDFFNSTNYLEPLKSDYKGLTGTTCFNRL